MNENAAQLLRQIYQLSNEGKLAEAADLTRTLVATGESLQGHHIRLATLVILATDWSLASSLLPRDTNFLQKSGWLHSLATGRPLNESNQPIPWFTYPAIDFLDGLVRPEWKVFEWGCGNSTLWWSARTAEVTAIEDNPDWHREISRQIPARVHLHLKTEQEYIEAILAYPDQTFDVVVVDGSHRNECSFHAINKVKPSGIIIFDNADAVEFRPGQVFLQKAGFTRLDFWGLIPSYPYKNCTSIHCRSLLQLQPKEFPSDHQSSVGISCFQAMHRAQV